PALSVSHLDASCLLNDALHDEVHRFIVVVTEVDLVLDAVPLEHHVRVRFGGVSAAHVARDDLDHLDGHSWDYLLLWAWSCLTAQTPASSTPHGTGCPPGTAVSWRCRCDATLSRCPRLDGHAA